MALESVNTSVLRTGERREGAWDMSALVSGDGTDLQRSRRIAHPTGIETHVDDRVLDLR